LPRLVTDLIQAEGGGDPAISVKRAAHSTHDRRFHARRLRHDLAVSPAAPARCRADRIGSDPRAYFARQRFV